MRILSVVSGLGYGGAESQLVLISSELQRRGHEVCIYSLTSHVPRLGQLGSSGVQTQVDAKQRRVDLGVLRRLRQFIKTWRPDVVHGLLFDGNWYATVAAVGTGVPVLCSERSSDYELNTAQRLAWLLARGFISGLVANSERGRAQAQAMLKLSRPHTHVVGNGLDLTSADQRLALRRRDYRSDFFGRADVRLVALVGSFNAAKDHPLAVQVAQQLVQLDGKWRLLFVGESFEGRLSYAAAGVDASTGYERAVRQQVIDADLTGHVCFTGQRDDALEIIADADVLLSTSKREGSPNVVFEAMATRTPVVATDFSDISRLLPFEWQIVKSRSPRELAERIQLAVLRKAEVVEHQRRWLENNGTVSSSADALLAVYAGYCQQGCAAAQAGAPPLQS